MLPAAHRLRRREDFTATIRLGRRVGRGAVVVHVDEPGATSGAPAPEPPRAGLVVSRGVGVAVQRNLVKRRLRHLMARRLSELAPGTRLVVRALPGSAQVNFAALAADLDGALDAARGRRTRRRTGPASAHQPGSRHEAR